MKHLITSLILMLSLTACAPALFVAGAAIGGAVVYDQRTAEAQLTDRNIDQIASNRISATKSLKASRIQIAAYNGVVLMVGQVSSSELRDQAYQLVSTIPHVTRIYNELTVSDSNGFFDTANDNLITTEVKTALLAEKGLKSTDIKVVTESSTVYLMGLVSPSQGEQAASVASRIKGVTKVVKVFQYNK